ncbi:GGDEF domain-containing protein [Desulfosporosinus lacus]|uniref:Diguanylate cyclase (GGDEF) domain-containing protein n=1 Tax=Desulfosporosinus lacus DSM 15449 TaxID=1121420 RepID=A0A1M6A444_9FIRM|nr:GGDEF domain-containing protein [Desulfosporosinus lacus]SHI31226.1 diguanylate cyclase (GGDEF) domain-containing protein [Desulfosporosinus lacus DSM 15449]
MAKTINVLQNSPHTILAVLGGCIGVLICLIYTFLPTALHLNLFVMITVILVVNGWLLGLIIRRLFINGYRDTLTGLGNKNMFYNTLKNEMTRTRSKDLCLAMLDLDNFKQINDTFGHIAGDTVLKKLAEILKQNTRGTDSVVRWGGEEFAIVMPHTSMQGAYALLERIRTIIESYDFGPQINSRQITFSSGVVSYINLSKVMQTKTNELNPLDLFVNLADKAMYRAKASKNTVVRWNEEYCA